MEDALPEHLKLAYLPGKAQVRLRLTGVGDERSALEKEMDEQIQTLIPMIQEYVFGFGEIEIENAVGEVLRANGLTISTCESCSGGYLAHRLTSVAGSSEYYHGSIVAYHNSIKMEEVGVEQKTLDIFGAVSEETAKEMAEGIRKKYKTDVGISTTGIAGPDGGTEEKPVGTVWLAISFGKNTFTRKLKLPGDRNYNIELTAIHAMNFLRETLQNLPD